jgi:hypothetical protein
MDNTDNKKLLESYRQRVKELERLLKEEEEMGVLELNIYLVSQEECTDWDTYDSFVVAEESEEAAKERHPDGTLLSVADDWQGTWPKTSGNVTATLIGKCHGRQKKGHVFCASFKAG